LAEQRSNIQLNGHAGGRILRRSVRVPLLALHAIAGLLLQFGLYALRPLHRHDQLERQATRLWHRVLCRLVGLRLQVIGEPVTGASLVVSNHVSWLDIPVIGGCLPAAFLSKAEVRRWPVVGWLASNAGTLYIERGAHGLREVSGAMGEALRHGRCVAFFPEGTTSPGDSVRRFLPPLFSAAIEAGVPVQPVAVRYPHGDRNHPHAPFVNDEPIGSHVWRLLGDPGFRAEVTFCKPLEATGARRRLAAEAQKAISQVISSSSGAHTSASAVGVGEATG
jgi:1-acyl-sn-glycerol-3-phosphate acyltransferase